MEERGGLGLTWVPSSCAWEDALMLYWGSLCLWAAIMFRHERKGQVAQLACERASSHGSAWHVVVLLGSPWSLHFLWFCQHPLDFLVKGGFYFRACGGSRCCEDGRFDEVVVLSTWTCSVCGGKSATFPLNLLPAELPGWALLPMLDQTPAPAEKWSVHRWDFFLLLKCK